MKKRTLASAVIVMVMSLMTSACVMAETDSAGDAPDYAKEEK